MARKIQVVLVAGVSLCALTILSYPLFHHSQCKVLIKRSEITAVSGEITGTITPAYGAGIPSHFNCKYDRKYARFSIKHPHEPPITYYPDTCEQGLDRIVAGPDFLGMHTLIKHQGLEAELPQDRIRGIGKCSAQSVTVIGTDFADGTGSISARWHRKGIDNDFEIERLPLQVTPQLSLADQAQELCDKPTELGKLALLTTDHARLSLNLSGPDKPDTLITTLHLPHKNASVTTSYADLEQGKLFSKGPNNPLSAFRPGDMTKAFCLLTGAQNN